MNKLHPLATTANHPPQQSTCQRFTLKTVLFFSIFIHTVNPAIAQIGGNATHSVNQQLRFLFAQTTPPQNTINALHDMSMHYSDSSWWVNNNYNVSNNANFTQLYSELYYAHYDTSTIQNLEDYWTDGLDFNNDTVAIGLIDYQYYKLKDSALFDSTYYYVDTNTLQLLDNPNRSSIPYHQKNVFIVCAFQDISYHGTLTYRVDPSFLLLDQTNQANYYNNSNFLFQLNFGDGNGWISFNTTSVQHHTVQYSSSCSKIEARIIDKTDPSTNIKYSASYKVAPKEQQFVPSGVQNWTNIQGLDIAYLPACSTSSSNFEEKFFIYLGGIDLSESVSTTDLIGDLYNNGLIDLRNYGYSFIIVDWKNSKKSLVDNAMSVVSLIDYLKCNKLDPNSDLHQPFVMMGESMGGVIGRYALAYMEKNPGQSICDTALMHNTRLFISEDAPHQGAYVPLSYQELYEQIATPIGDGHTLLNATLPFSIKMKMLEMFTLHQTPAVKQLLSLHSTTSLSGTGTGQYTEHNDRKIFLQQLEALSPSTNGWPQHCKLVGISQGLLTGQHQLGGNEDCLASPGDYYYDVEADLNATILGIPVLGVYYDLNLNKIDPSGNLAFSQWGAGINHWGIQIQWDKVTIGWCPFCVKVPYPTGVNVGLLSTEILNGFKKAVNTEAYDLMPGGYFNALPEEPIDFSFGQVEIKNTIWPPDLSVFQVKPQWLGNPTPTNCTPAEVASIDFDLVFIGFDVKAHTQGARFCFIPTRSALDFNTSYALDYDIYALPTSTKMNNTPFDVIMGEFNLNTNPQDFINNVITNNGQTNEQHVDHEVYNNELNLSDTIRYDYRGRWLNREAGDRVLMLENLAMNHNAKIIAEKEIYGGSNLNPYYEYPNTNSISSFRYYSTFQNNGVFSKDDPLISAPTLTLQAGQVYDAGIVGSYSTILLEQLVCDSNHTAANKKPQVLSEEIAENLDYSIYPNPVTNHLLTIKFLDKKGWHTLEVYNLHGQHLLHIKILAEAGEVHTLQLPKHIKKGAYLLQLKSNEHIHSQTIIVQ